MSNLYLYLEQDPTDGVWRKHIVDRPQDKTRPATTDEILLWSALQECKAETDRKQESLEVANRWRDHYETERDAANKRAEEAGE